jgi:hypothetical protein
MGLLGFLRSVADASDGDWLVGHRDSPVLRLEGAHFDEVYDRAGIFENSIINFLGNPSFIVMCEDLGTMKRNFFGCSLFPNQQVIDIYIKRTETLQGDFSSEEKYLKQKIKRYPTTALKGFMSFEKLISDLTSGGTLGIRDASDSWLGKVLS